MQKTKNVFTKGLVLDFSPENTKNQVLTHALNATLLTFNGNEMSLQNDMGNARVETAYLPDGYIPVGTCEYGGIIYIVSYNPLEDKSQIGCFPSPERNISNEELGIQDALILTSDFQELDMNNNPTGTIKNSSSYVLLKTSKLNPGDKFIISANEEIYKEQLSDLLVDGLFKNNPILKLNIVSIEDSGKIIYLNSSIRSYEKTLNGSNYSYHIIGESTSNTQTIDIDSYRNVLSSGYNVFKSKVSGKLAILAELVMIDNYSISHSLEPILDNDGNQIDGAFNLNIYPEVLYEDGTIYDLAPKLKYYYLSKSEQQLEVKSDIINSNILDTKAEDVWTNLEADKKLSDIGFELRFPNDNTYHNPITIYSGEISGVKNSSLYTNFVKDTYYLISKSQVETSEEYLKNLGATFYQNASFSDGEKVSEIKDDTEGIYFIESDEYKQCGRYQIDNHEVYYISNEPVLIESEEILNSWYIEKYIKEEEKIYELLTEEMFNKLTDKSNVYLYDGLEFIQKDYFLENVTYLQKNVTFYTSIGFTPANVSEVYYYPTLPEYIALNEDEKEEAFPQENITPKYPIIDGKLQGYPYLLFIPTNNIKYSQVTSELLEDESLTIMYIDPHLKPINSLNEFNETTHLYIKFTTTISVTSDYFIPDPLYNCINEVCPENALYYPGYSELQYNSSLSLYTVQDFLSKEENNYPKYDPLNLASVKLPKFIQQGAVFPFKYTYSITPCMCYGKLDHLTVTNSVNFKNLYSFSNSDFNVWKYRIDGNQLRLTVGAEVFDTFEPYKVDQLFLEFYDYRGFAGSLSIDGKKSYSGVFTKILALNTLNTLKPYRVIDGKLTLSGARNIQIKKTEDNTYTLFDKAVTYDNNEWTYSDGSPVDNDCGIVYSNIIYGVKLYMRRYTPNGYEFIPKKDMFLFTMPLYNDHYYTVDNFNTLINPKVLMALTYRLTDKSSRRIYKQYKSILDTEYNSTEVGDHYYTIDSCLDWDSAPKSENCGILYYENEVFDGYSITDYNNLLNYKNAKYTNDSLELVRYYTYAGTTSLLIEIGLNKEYEKYNLWVDRKINEEFSYGLELISEDADSTFTVTSEDPNATKNDILNYSEDRVSDPQNLFGFSSNFNPEISVSDTYLPGSDKSIGINYKFVAGYKTIINDVEARQVPVSTICALCHRNNGEYNYRDFGIREETKEEIKDEKTEYVHYYYNNVGLYNAGNGDYDKFGTFRLGEPSGSTDQPLLHQITTFNECYNEKSRNVLNFPLNTGDMAKAILPHIGKLTFCQPHLHGRFLRNNEGYVIEEGANITYTWPFDSNSGISYYQGLLLYPRLMSDINDASETTHGVIGSHYGAYAPRFIMSVNTREFINNLSEFISSMGNGPIEYTETLIVAWAHAGDHNIREDKRGWGILYKALNHEQLKEFNKKMLETMRYVYAFNPDYDTIEVNYGRVNVLEYVPNINSNIICKNVKFSDNFCLNLHLKIESITMSDYLDELKTYSGIEIKDENDYYIGQINFTPDLSLCGEGTPCLITELTYKLPVPELLAKDYDYSDENLIMIRHHDGSSNFITGEFDKKALYGYSKEHGKIVSINDNNYTISDTGELKINSKEIENISGYVLLTNPARRWNKELALADGTKIQPYFIGSTLKLTDLEYDPFTEHRLYVRSGLHKQLSSLLVYYRSIKSLGDSSTGDWKSEYDYGSYKNYNTLYLYTGPGYYVE